MSPATSQSGNPTRGSIAFAFALVYVFWGSTYLAIRIAIEHIPPAMMTGVRFLIAGSLMLAWCWFTGRRVKIGRTDARRLATVGVLLLTGGNLMVAWSEQYVPSGMAALIVAGVPLWVLVVEWLVLRGERLSVAGLGGLALGIAGMVVLLWPKLTSGNTLGQRELIGAAGLIFASASWATGSVCARRWHFSVDAFAASAWEMTFAGCVNVAISLLSGEYHRTVWAPRSVTAMIYLVIFGSWVGFSAYIWLLDHVPTAKVATYAYVNPLVAVLLGWLVLHEQVDAYILAGTAIILSGVALVTTAKIKGGSPVRLEPELPACESGAD